MDLSFTQSEPTKTLMILIHLIQNFKYINVNVGRMNQIRVKEQINYIVNNLAFTQVVVYLDK